MLESTGVEGGVVGEMNVISMLGEIERGWSTRSASVLGDDAGVQKQKKWYASSDRALSRPSRTHTLVQTQAHCFRAHLRRQQGCCNGIVGIDGFDATMKARTVKFEI